MDKAFSGTADSYIEYWEDTIAQLRRLGFTDYESRAYLALCESYPATAYEVSKKAKLPKAQAKRTRPFKRVRVLESG